MQTQIILASTSRVRQQLLTNAGIAHTTHAPAVDEAEIKRAQAGAAPAQIAATLAAAKARSVSKLHPEALVIGADQVLAVNDGYLDKPRDIAEARRHLQILSGKTHALLSAICCARGGDIQWSHIAEAHLVMRDLSTRFLDQYVADCGTDILTSVGGYKLESRGIQLFTSIRGDYFTILGLPLLPLLQYFRDIAVIAT